MSHEAPNWINYTVRIVMQNTVQIQLDSHTPSNPDERHYFDDSDEHFPVSAECSDFKKVNENILPREKIFLLPIHKCQTSL